MIEVSVLHMDRVPSVLQGQELCIEVAMIVDAASSQPPSVVVSEVLTVPLLVSSTMHADTMPHTTLPTTVSGTFELDRDLWAAIEFPFRDDHSRNEMSGRSLLNISATLSVYLAPRSSTVRARASSVVSFQSPTPSSPSHLSALLSSVSWEVSLIELLHTRKVIGVLVPTTVGNFGIRVGLDHSDQIGFEHRLTQFFTAVNPSRLGNIATIMDVDGVDEVSVFSKLHTKYFHEVPAFHERGTFEERVLDFFEVYSLGSDRAAKALLSNWSGRELELLATLSSENGPEPWQIDCEKRLFAYCSVNSTAMPSHSFDALQGKLADLGELANATIAEREFFVTLRAQYGPEPHPQEYAVRSATGVATNELLLEAYGEFLVKQAPHGNNEASRKRLVADIASVSDSKLHEDRSRSLSVTGIGMRDYVQMQFGPGSKGTPDAYKHLTEDEQRDLHVVRQVHTGSNLWPLGSEDATIAAALQRMDQSSFVYDDAAQSAVTGRPAPQQSASRSDRVLTMKQIEKKQIALNKLDSMRIARLSSGRAGSDDPGRSRSASATSRSNGAGSVVSSHPHQDPPRGGWWSDVNTQSVESHNVPLEDDPERVREEDLDLVASLSVLGMAHQASLSQHTVGSFVRPSAPVDFSHYTQSSIRNQVRSAEAMPPRPVQRDAIAQTNPYGDLPPAQLQEFLLTDVHSNQYAWATFVDAAEMSLRIPYHRLLYLSEAKFDAVCMEVGVPIDLRDSIVAERQRMILASLRVRYYDPNTPVLKQMQEALVVIANHNLSLVQIRRVGMGAEIFHKIHRGIFQEHLDQFAEQRKHREGAGTMSGRSSRGVGVKHNPEGIAKKVFLVRCSASNFPVPSNSNYPSPNASTATPLYGTWEDVAFGISHELPVRFPHDFWSAVRTEYRAFVAAASASPAHRAAENHIRPPPPMFECSFDVLICSVLQGNTVMETTSLKVDASLPEVFDSAVYGVGHPSEEATVIYNTQHILVEAVLFGCCFDPDLLPCERHPDVPSCFRKGQARQLLPEDTRRSLTAADLLELQAVPAMCLQCLATRALLQDPTVLKNAGHAKSSDVAEGPTSRGVSSTPRPTVDGNEGFGILEASTAARPPKVHHHGASRSIAEPEDRPRVQLDRAWGLWSSGNTHGCLAALERLALDFPHTSEASESQGLLCELMDQHYVNAAAHYREATRRNPLSASAFYRLGNVLETRFGASQEAMDAFERAADLGDAIARRRLLASAHASLKSPASQTRGDHNRHHHGGLEYSVKPQTDVPPVVALRPPVSGGAIAVGGTNHVKRRF
jgi:hypothetical protein